MARPNRGGSRTSGTRRRRNVVPDRLDFRDRLYAPAVAIAPPPRMPAKLSDLPIPKVRDQGETSACTGFALAAVIDTLLRRAGRAADADVSEFMLYSMARRYDEFPGYKADEGSSVRGALKGWYKHGACSRARWSGIDMPKPVANPARDWWPDAARRPMGAYYRVDTRSVVDMQVALNEVGVLYASAVCHEGWDQGVGARRPARGKHWIIPARKADIDDGGHAFAIVGYDEDGFLVLNSWGEGWGTRGLAVLTYDDWLANAMDCWVAQLGVVTRQHELIASSASLRSGAGGHVMLARDERLRNHEIAPFVVDMENNGLLSSHGEFRTQESDLEALLDIHMVEARRAFGLAKAQPLDVAIYAHGGLVGEKAAAETAATWIRSLYGARVFPIFLMWESDLLSTLKGRLTDLVRGAALPTAGLLDQLPRWWNERVERALAEPGAFLWDEMKQNARSIADNPESGVRKLLAMARDRKLLGDAQGRRPSIRLHLVGHSAGSIVHARLIHRMLAELPALTIDSVDFMAPAIRLDDFEREVAPHLEDGGRIGIYRQFHLTDVMEQADPTCRPILLYGRSLLYLLSMSFERGRNVPIAGMQKFWDPWARRRRQRVQGWASPSEMSSATTHGGFGDEGERTVDTIVRFIAPRRSKTTERATTRPELP